MSITAAIVVGGGRGALFNSTVTLDATTLADAHNTPPILVPAQGEGTVAGFLGSFSVIKKNGGPGFGTGPSANIDWDGAGIGLIGAADDLFYNYSDEEAFYNQALAVPSDIVGVVLADVENKALVLYAPSPISVRGAIDTSAIGAAGTGYAELEEVTLEDATLRIDTVGGGGEVLTYTVLDAGTMNIIGDNQATTGGGGTGFELNITALDYSVNPLTVKIDTLFKRVVTG